MFKQPQLICIFSFLFISFSIVNAQDKGDQPWLASEVWTPVPKIVEVKNNVPSDAIILFDGENLESWRKPQNKNEVPSINGVNEMLKDWQIKDGRGAAPWKVGNGYFEVVPGAGAVETRQVFGDVQLHIEWNPPVAEGKTGQGYSNSGIFFMGLYELQILNSYENRTYSNGMAASIYKQHRPLANPAHAPGNWQTYDIVFNAPKFGTNGKLISPAYITAFFNGVLVQNHTELEGPTLYIGESEYIPHDAKLPIRLQDHGDKIQFRNIWVREL